MGRRLRRLKRLGAQARRRPPVKVIQKAKGPARASQGAFEAVKRALPRYARINTLVPGKKQGM